jgi:hypothetical protein
VTLNPTMVCRRDELRRQPQGSRVVDIDALESFDGDDNHPRTSHLASPRLERRVRVRQHVWRQLGRHELALGVDNA